MICRKCGYQLLLFEKECPRCAQNAKASPAQSSSSYSPMAKSAQEAMAREMKCLEKRQARSISTPVSIAFSVLFCIICVVVPICFSQYVWKNSTISRIGLAAKQGDLAKVKEMVSIDPTLVNTRGYLGRPPLFWAATAGRREMVSYLLDKKAKLDNPDQRGWTPLHAAAYSHQLAMVQYLVSLKADYHLKDATGRSAFQIATAGGSIEVADYLRQKGLPVNEKDDKGETALHIAVHGKQLAMVNYLLANGANVNEKNNDNETPLALANKLKQSDAIVTALMDHGASE